MGNEYVPFYKFPSLCNILLSCSALMASTLYHNEKAYAEMVLSIFSVIQTQVLDRVRDSK